MSTKFFQHEEWNSEQKLNSKENFFFDGKGRCKFSQNCENIKIAGFATQFN
jgi:hypothetical protein